MLQNVVVKYIICFVLIKIYYRIVVSYLASQISDLQHQPFQELSTQLQLPRYPNGVFGPTAKL